MKYEPWQWTIVVWPWMRIVLPTYNPVQHPVKEEISDSHLQDDLKTNHRSSHNSRAAHIIGQTSSVETENDAQKLVGKLEGAHSLMITPQTSCFRLIIRPEPANTVFILSECSNHKCELILAKRAAISCTKIYSLL